MPTLTPPTSLPRSLTPEEWFERFALGGALLHDSPEHVLEVVGILKSYGIVLDAYARNLNYIAENQFLRLFPFFKYFNGEVSTAQLLKHWRHDRINFEYAEYCMKAMFWHGGGGLDAYLDTPEFMAAADAAIKARWQGNPAMLGLHKLFPNYLPEQVRQYCYYSGLGQFWTVMSEIFLILSDRYDAGEIKTVPDVVQHVLDGLVKDAAKPITYGVEIRGKTYDIMPKSLGLTFLMDTGVPYVEAIFFRGTPFPGTISYNAQAYQIPFDQGLFAYGALYADPLPIGGSGIPPTLLMQDMRHFLPDYLMDVYRQTTRKEEDILIQICQTFQKSMFCVTTAAIRGLAPHPLDSEEPEEQAANHAYLKGWIDRLEASRLARVA